MVLYMCSSFWLLGVESRDFSHAALQTQTLYSLQDIPVSQFPQGKTLKTQIWLVWLCYLAGNF